MNTNPRGRIVSQRLSAFISGSKFLRDLCVFVVQLSIVEPPTPPGDFHEHRRSLKPLPKRRIFLKLLDDFRDSHLVGPEKQSAAEWWKPDSQNQTQIDIAHISHDLIFEHPRRLDEHRQKQP